MTCQTHTGHDHRHGAGCGHQTVQHDDHVCYLHDGHLHFVHDDHVDEHVYAGEKGGCTPEHKCGEHEDAHTHGANCGHLAVPHGDHVDYVVNGHLHSPCKEHCDDHGAISAA